MADPSSATQALHAALDAVRLALQRDGVGAELAQHGGGEAFATAAEEIAHHASLARLAAAPDDTA